MPFSRQRCRIRTSLYTGFIDPTLSSSGCLVERCLILAKEHMHSVSCATVPLQDMSSISVWDFPSILRSPRHLTSPSDSSTLHISSDIHD